MKIRKRTILYAVIAIVVIVLLVLAFRPQAVSVETTTVKRGPMSVAVEARGETRAIDRYVITSPIAGNLERIPLRPGDLLRQSEVVARIAPASLSGVAARQAEAAERQARAAVTDAEAALDRAQEESALASREEQRLSGLDAEGAIPHQEFDEVVTRAQTAAHAVESARAIVAQARANLAAARAALLSLKPGHAGVVALASPVDARIFAIPERSGRAVLPGDPIMTLGNPHRIEAVIDLLSQDAVRTKPGDQAQLIDWGGGAPIPGVVKTVESSAFTKVSALGIEEQRVHVIITIPDPPPTLGDAYRVQGRITVWQSPNVVQIPIGSLVRFGTDWGVYIVDKGRAHKRIIHIAHRNEDTAEVLSGLQPGETVIVHPGDDVEDGGRVAGEGE